VSGSFAGATIRVLSARVTSLLLGIATSVVLARWLGPEGKGLYSLAVLLPTLLVTLLNLGVGPSTVFHLARRDFSAATARSGNLLLALLLGIAGVIVGGVLVLLLPSRLFPGVPQVYLYAVLLLIPLRLAHSYLQHVLQGIQEFGKYSLFAVLHSLLLLLLVLLILVVLGRGIGGALLATGLAALGTLAIQIGDAQRREAIRLRVSIDYVKRVLSYGWKAHLATVTGFLNYRIDMLLVNAYLGAVPVGLYSVGVGLVEKLWLIPNAASAVLYPRVSGETRESERKWITAIVTRTTLWITAAVAILLVLLCRPVIVLLYSDAYIGGVRAAQILVVGVVAMAASKPLATDLAGRGRPMLNTYISLVTLATNVVLNILLIPRYRIIGAAWASTVSYCVTFALRVIVYSRVSKAAWHSVLLLRRGDFATFAEALRSSIRRARR